MGEKLSNEQVIEAVQKYNGNLSAVARALGVARNTVYAHIEKYATAKAALDNAREAMLDNAESVLYRKVLEGSTPELLFFLKTQGKTRGYTEKQEIEHSGPGGGPIVIDGITRDTAAAELAEWRKQQAEKLSGQNALQIPPTSQTST